MAYEESYFFGKCNVVCEAETTADNGKTVTITDGTNSFTGTIVNRVASFFIPGKSTYTVTLSDNGTTEWTGTIAAGYGENIHIMLADGYESIKEKQIMSAQEIAAATAGTLGNAVPDADAFKALNENLNAKADSQNVFELQSTPTLTQVTMPYTATKNVMANLRFTTQRSNLTYVYLVSAKFGNYYLSPLIYNGGNARHSEWFPITKGDTISIDTQSGASDITLHVLE